MAATPPVCDFGRPAVDVELDLASSDQPWCEAPPAGTRVFLEFDLDMLRARTWAQTAVDERI